MIVILHHSFATNLIFWVPTLMTIQITSHSKINILSLKEGFSTYLTCKLAINTQKLSSLSEVEFLISRTHFSKLDQTLSYSTSHISTQRCPFPSFLAPNPSFLYFNLILLLNIMISISRVKTLIAHGHFPI